ncbi:MAG: glycoside hydrolase family 127 protein [Mogibacterium sp.]|nr:glycoside hydrolase family 127 protein [Mogibacterium sp.]
MSKTARTSHYFKTGSLRYPGLPAIRLLPGTPFYDRQRDMNIFLLSQDADSMLYNFRKAAGLPTHGAKPMQGWDADECKLKGHTTGHYMSGLALAYAATGDVKFKNKLDYIVAGLAECQSAFASMEGIKPGFLSAYSEEQFDLLEQGTPYPEIWAPYYTLDKIMSGLLDAYDLADNKQALEILSPLGDWVYARLSRLTDEARCKMWDTYIAGEYGCMIVTMVRLYRLTGKTEHLEAAKLFDNPVLFDQMEAGRDGLDGMHANQHIPQIMGALELYRETGEERYYAIAQHFEEIVIAHHCYAIGGTGEQERFRAADSECSLLTESTAESCASYNMLRLTSGLYRYTADPVLMAYFENTLFNHILASFSHSPDGGTTYFMPLEPGSCRHYDTEDENSCCHGTGMETRYRYMQQIFSYRMLNTDELLQIELPIPAALDDDEKLHMEFTDDGILTVTADAEMKRQIAIRIPAWAADEQSTSARNAEKHSADSIIYEGRPDAEIKDGYLVLGDRLAKGESVSLRLPFKLRLNTAPSDSRYSYLSWGPYLLAALSDRKELISPPDIKAMKPAELMSAPDSDISRGVFRCGDTVYLPFYMADTQACHLYYHK